MPHVGLARRLILVASVLLLLPLGGFVVVRGLHGRCEDLARSRSEHGYAISTSSSLWPPGMRCSMVLDGALERDVVLPWQW